MNWFTRQSTKSVNLEEVEDHCTHLKTGDRAHIHREMDSFGVVGEMALCEACHQNSEKAKEEELMHCHDCGGEFPAKQTIAWKPYDFYPPQGDEPLIVCHGCVGKIRHQKRVHYDRYCAMREMGGDEY